VCCLYRKMYTPDKNKPQRGFRKPAGKRSREDSEHSDGQDDSDAEEQPEASGQGAIRDLKDDDPAATVPLQGARWMSEAAHSDTVAGNVAFDPAAAVPLDARGLVMSAPAERHAVHLDAEMQAIHGTNWRPYLPQLQFLSDSGVGEDRIYQTHWREVTKCVSLSTRQMHFGGEL
jgi:hypothetical protein